MAVEFYFKRGKGGSGKVDDSTAKHITELAEKLKGALKVGFLAGATYPDGTSVAQVAFWNEFGTKRAPARPFFRTVIAKQQKTWGENLAKALAYYKGDGHRALASIGQSISDDISVSIQRWTAPPNAKSTIARKGFDKPLVHTSVMVRAPDYVVID